MPRCVWLLGFAAIVSIFMLSTECFRGKHIPRCKPFSKSVPLGLDPVPIEMYRKRTVESRQSTNFGDECSIPLVAVVLLDAGKSSIPNTLSMFLSAFPKAHAVVVTSSSAHALAASNLGGDRMHWLTASDQQRMYPSLAAFLPVGNARKNLGYLHAIAVGACYIFDSHADVNASSNLTLLSTLHDGPRALRASDMLGVLHSKGPALNPYPIFGPELYVWPRGYPLKYTAADFAWPSLHSTLHVSNWSIDIVQIIASAGGLDVDDVWTSQHGQSLRWNPAKAMDNGTLLGIAPASIAPFNARSTVFSRRAAWAMYLPHSVHAHVSDVWRAYVAQAVLPKTSGLLAFTGPQDLGPHQLQQNASHDEDPALYESAILCAFISNLKLNQSALDAVAHGDALDGLMMVYVQAATRGLLNYTTNINAEIHGFILWAQALRQLGYAAPEMTAAPPEQISQVRVHDDLLGVVQINFAAMSVFSTEGGKQTRFEGYPTWRTVPLWRALHPELPHVVFFLAGASPCPSIAGLDVVCTQGANGFTSYQNVFQAWRRYPNFSHYLFAHEDAVVRRSSLKGMLLSGLSAHAPYTGLNLSTDWAQFRAADKSIATLHTTQRVPPCPQHVANRWHFGQSDWFLLVQNDVERMAGPADVYYWAALFLEAAVPTLFACHAPNATQYDLHVDWNPNTRDNSTAMALAFCLKSDRAVLHRIKLSLKSDVQAFMHAREC